MSTVGDLRSALRDNIKSAIDWQVSPYRIGSPVPPGVMIVRGAIRPHRAFNQGLMEYDFRVLAFVAEADRVEQIKLDELLEPSGPGSMIEAIESDPTLGGIADDVTVSGDIPEEQILVGADNMGRVIAEWLVTVYVDGST